MQFPESPTERFAALFLARPGKQHPKLAIHKRNHLSSRGRKMVPRVNQREDIMNQDQKEVSPAVEAVARALCAQYQRGKQAENPRAGGGEPWQQWITPAETVLKGLSGPGTGRVTVPGWVLDTLTKDVKMYYAQVGDAIGRAGHAASEQLQIEFEAVEVAENALVGVTLSPPPFRF
jgi:hypothetical protein